MPSKPNMPEQDVDNNEQGLNNNEEAPKEKGGWRRFFGLSDAPAGDASAPASAVESQEVSSQTGASIGQSEEQSVGGHSVDSAVDNAVEEVAAKREPAVDEKPVATDEPRTSADEQVVAFSEESEQGFFTRMKTGLGKTRASFTKGLADVLIGKKEIDDDIFEQIETQLLLADVGMEATLDIVERLTGKVSRAEVVDSDALFEALKDELASLLEGCEPLNIDSAKAPFVILMVGVNGVGKTTTIGKLAKRYQAEGKSVMLAAGDTFRAAAVEQLQAWGDLNNVPVVAQHTGADSASVLFDALQSAQSKNVDVLIADTAGRLQNKSHLMEELEKVLRVMKKVDPSAPHEVMLVLDACTGQNALRQVEDFSATAGVTGLTITKLDGTAKGGVVFSLARNSNIPIRYIGVGEKVDDLKVFDADAFVAALFDEDGLDL